LPPDFGVRPFEPAEWPVVASWVLDEAGAVAWGGPWVTWPVDQAQFERMMTDPVRTLWTPTLGGVLAGHFQLAADERRRTARLGRVAIAPELRGRGLGTALARAACDIAFRRDPVLHRVELQVYEHNAPARAAYRRAGFSVEGILREDVPVASAVWSTILMAVLRPEWEAAQAPSPGGEGSKGAGKVQQHPNPRAGEQGGDHARLEPEHG
jgi:RimJ/RimL family protein N-acetyltransferase